MGSVVFQPVETRDQTLTLIQQNISAAVAALQAAQQAAAQGITQVSASYTLQPTDHYLLVASNKDVVVSLGPPNVIFISVIVNQGPGSVSVRTADNKTDLGKVAAGSSITVVSNAKAWSKI